MGTVGTIQQQGYTGLGAPQSRVQLVLYNNRGIRDGAPSPGYSWYYTTTGVYADGAPSPGYSWYYTTTGVYGDPSTIVAGTVGTIQQQGYTR